MAKSLFLEGTDGSGKSTQFALLKEYLASKGLDFLALREPGGSDYYEALREFYLQSTHDHPAISDALISAAGRAANIAETKATLEKEMWVISDRCYLSSYVYQAVQGVALEDIKKINSFALNGFAYDIKIVLDVPVEIAEQRINQSDSKKDHWEAQGRDFFEKIRKAYLEIAASEGCHIIDATKTPDGIHQEIIALLDL